MSTRLYLASLAWKLSLSRPSSQVYVCLVLSDCEYLALEEERRRQVGGQMINRDEAKRGNPGMVVINVVECSTYGFFYMKRYHLHYGPPTVFTFALSIPPSLS